MKRGRPQLYTDRQITDKLERAVARCGQGLTRKTFDQTDGPTSRMVVQRLASWDRAKSQTRSWSYIELLQTATARLGHSPSLPEFNQLQLDVQAHVIKRHFGSWNAAKQAAGLETCAFGASNAPVKTVEAQVKPLLGGKPVQGKPRTTSQILKHMESKKTINYAEMQDLIREMFVASAPARRAA
jgi:hypothetical protein